MLAFLPEEILKRNRQFSLQLFLCVLLLTSFSDRFPLLSCFPLFLLIFPPLTEMHLYENNCPHLFLREFLGLLSQPRISVCLWRPVFIHGLPTRTRRVHRDNFLAPHPADYRGNMAAAKGSVPSEHLVSSLPSPLCFWSWHFFVLRCIHDVTFFVDVPKCALELFWLSIK